MVAGSIPARLTIQNPCFGGGFCVSEGVRAGAPEDGFGPHVHEKLTLRGVRPCVRPLLWPLNTAGRFRPLFGEVGYWLQGWGRASPGDLPALGPEYRLRAGGCAGTDLHAESFAVTKELLGDTEAEDGVEACLQGERGAPAAEGADPVVSGSLAPLTLALDANGNSHKDEATVGRELTRLRPVLLYSLDADLPEQLAQARILQQLAVAGRVGEGVPTSRCCPGADSVGQPRSLDRPTPRSVPDQSYDRMAVRAQRGRSARQSTHSLESNPDRLGYASPPLILLTFQSPEVDRGNREGRVVQKQAHLLHRFPGLSSQLRRRVPKDVDSGRWEPSRLEVPL